MKQHHHQWERKRRRQGGVGLQMLAGVSALLVSGAASAQQLIYEPINPSFGGNPFNSAHLLALANAQNRFEAPLEDDPFSQSEQFVNQLQSRLLSSLAAQVTDAIFGPDPAESGTVIFGDQVIDFNRTLDGVELSIIDNSLGSTTNIFIPSLNIN